MASELLHVDGSSGEGGGQILRTSLTLSLITGRPFRLEHIRAGRSKPGLQAQHLACVQAAEQISGAVTRGASLGSTTLEFEPGTVRGGEYHIRIGTAGATSLVLHTLYLPLLRAAETSVVTIEGGTHVPFSPCFHFLDRTWNAYLVLLGAPVKLGLDRVGFYPRGGGRITAELMPVAAINSLTLPVSGSVTRARVLSAVAGLPSHISQRQAQRAAEGLAELGLEVEVEETRWSDGTGTMVGIELPTEPVPTFYFSLGERGKPAEAVADAAVAQVAAFVATGPAGVDEHSADQLLLPLALAAGASSLPTARITSHLLTNAAVIQRFLSRRIEIDGAEGQAGVVRILAGE